MPEWKRYKSAVCESNRDKLGNLVFKLEGAVVLRVHAILAVAQRVWVEWAFKPSKESLLMDTDQEQIR